MEFIVPPLLWWIILPAALLGGYAWAQTRRAREAIRFSDIGLLRAALAGRPSTAGRRHIPPALMALGLGVAAVALARPAVRVPIPKERVTIVLVLDVSGSMSASDMFPSRLSAAKRSAKAFVDTLPPGFRVGVVSFSSQASLVQPVTEDHGAVRAAIDGLETGGGTAIGEGIQVALAALPPEPPPAPALPVATPRSGATGQPPPPPGVILLLTDGENTAGVPPLDATRKAREINVPIFTIGMGSRGGGLGFRRGGGGIDEPLLQEIAAQTGGQYYHAPGGGELRRVYGDLGLALGWDFERHEIGHYFAGAAVLVTVGGLCLAFLWLHRQP
ncbi:MAG: VWA domain-containing protein [Chloroflexi bacterium]|nr:VWA domain-containing protein [Chloroflexota bacterium]